MWEIHKFGSVRDIKQSREVVKMSTRQKLILFSVLCLVLSSCIAKHSGLSFSEKKYIDSRKGQTYYTKTNIWYTNPEGIPCFTHLKGSILPVGMKVKILHCGERQIKFIMDSELAKMDSEVPFCLVHYRKSSINFKQLFNRYFSKEDVMAEGGAFSKLTIEEQNNVKNGNVSYGMSKEAALMAYGYPPSGWVPNPLLSNFWEYFGKSNIWRKRIYFMDNKVSKIEDVEFGRKVPFAGRRKRITVQPKD